MMKSPRTPKMDITLKKPFIHVGTLKQMAEPNLKSKKPERPEVLPYHSRVKAMAMRTVDGVKEDGKTSKPGEQDSSR